MNTSVMVRPLVAEDRCAFTRFYSALSPRSIYLRFFAPMPRLPKRTLDWLVNTDQDRHAALGAWAGDDELVAEARYVVTDDDSAEIALTVRDDWQRRGVGMMLVQALALQAQRNGICRLTASTLAQNEGIRRLLGRAGFVRSGAAEGTVDWERNQCFPYTEALG